MLKLYESGIYLVNRAEIITDPAALPQVCGRAVTQSEAVKGTMAYSILKAHNTSGDMDDLKMMAGCGKMILGSDSHTRYGALGCMGVGEGGGELAKQLVGRTYDFARPGVVAI